MIPAKRRLLLLCTNVFPRGGSRRGGDIRYRKSLRQAFDPLFTYMYLHTFTYIYSSSLRATLRTLITWVYLRHAHALSRHRLPSRDKARNVIPPGLINCRVIICSRIKRGSLSPELTPGHYLTRSSSSVLSYQIFVVPPHKFVYSSLLGERFPRRDSPVLPRMLFTISLMPHASNVGTEFFFSFLFQYSPDRNLQRRIRSAGYSDPPPRCNLKCCLSFALRVAAGGSVNIWLEWMMDLSKT